MFAARSNFTWRQHILLSPTDLLARSRLLSHLKDDHEAIHGGTDNTSQLWQPALAGMPPKGVIGDGGVRISTESGLDAQQAVHFDGAHVLYIDRA